MTSAVCSSSFSFWQAAALPEEAREHAAREAAWGGRMAVARSSELPQVSHLPRVLPDPLPASTSWSAFALSKLHEDR